MTRVLAKRALVAHPARPAPDVQLGAKLSLFGSDVLKIEYAVIGAIGRLAIPPRGIPMRVDRLWEHSCLELFVADRAGPGYVEFNFAPSNAFAIYRFEDRRSGMVPALDCAAPDIWTDVSSDRFALTAYVDFAGEGELAGRSVGVSAVIEETDGAKSYWALAHPGAAPDFHDPAGWTLRLG